MTSSIPWNCHPVAVGAAHEADLAVKRGGNHDIALLGTFDCPEPSTPHNACAADELDREPALLQRHAGALTQQGTSASCADPDLS